MKVVNQSKTKILDVKGFCLISNMKSEDKNDWNFQIKDFEGITVFGTYFQKERAEQIMKDLVETIKLDYKVKHCKEICTLDDIALAAEYSVYEFPKE